MTLSVIFEERGHVYCRSFDGVQQRFHLNLPENLLTLTRVLENHYNGKWCYFLFFGSKWGWKLNIQDNVIGYPGESVTAAEFKKMLVVSDL